MPLRAIINNEEVISIFLTEEEWNSLRAYTKSNHIEVIISQTGKSGYLRTSKLGLQHFAHKRGEKPDNWQPESHQHLFAKSQVLLGCKDAGWEAKSEYIENDWIADVIAVKGDIRVAFEIQWSKQSYAKTVERQDKYDRDGVRGCWFFKRPPKKMNRELMADKRLPIFVIFETENEDVCVKLGSHNIKLREFVRILLEKKIKFCEYITSFKRQKIQISFMEYECYKCKTLQHIYFIQNYILSKCWNRLDFHDEDWSDQALKYHPKIINAVNDFLKTEKGDIIKIGSIKKRHSNQTNSYYKSFGCYRCDTIFGDWHLHSDILQAMHEDNPCIFVDIEMPVIKVKDSHWCYSESRDFCE